MEEGRTRLHRRPSLKHLSKANPSVPIEKSLSAMKQLSYILIIGLISVVTSCKPGVPDPYIQPGQMEDILYDYHLAQGVLQEEGKNSEVDKQAYKLAVLKKYGISEADFESSMEYYMRHTERMHDIYEQLAQRFESEAIAQGASVSDLAQYGSMTARGDTADIWVGEKSVVLSPHPPFHKVSFSIKADTAFHKGDRMMLNFDSQFIMQEGSRDGVAVLAVTFSNDSVASQMRRVITNTHYTLQIDDRERLGIKSVRGFLLFNRGMSNAATTLKLLSLTNIPLIRMHVSQADTTAHEAVPAMQENGRHAMMQDSTMKEKAFGDSARRHPRPLRDRPIGIPATSFETRRR